MSGIIVTVLFGVALYLGSEGREKEAFIIGACAGALAIAAGMYS